MLFQLALQCLDLKLLLLLNDCLLHLVHVVLLSLLVNVEGWWTEALARESSR